MIFLRSLINSKYPQVSMILLSILTDLNNVVRMISTRLPVPVPSMRITTGITDTFMLIIFFSSLAFISLVFFLQIHREVNRNGKFHYLASSLFFCLLSISMVVWLRLGDPFVSQNHREVCASHFPGWNPGCAYTNYSYCQI